MAAAAAATATSEYILFSEDSCRGVSGNEIRIGDEFTTANMRFKCAKGHFEVVGQFAQY